MQQDTGRITRENLPEIIKLQIFIIVCVCSNIFIYYLLFKNQLPTVWGRTHQCQERRQEGKNKLVKIGEKRYRDTDEETSPQTEQFMCS